MEYLYIYIDHEGNFLIPVGGMKVTEANLKANDNVQITLGSKEVEGFHAKGTGFLIRAKGEFAYEGADFEEMKEKLKWCRAVLKIKPESITQTL